MSHPDPDEAENPGHGAEVAGQREAFLKQILDAPARMRLGNIRMVKPELAASLENYLISMASQNKIGARITDEQLKQILQSMQQPKRDFKINRV